MSRKITLGEIAVDQFPAWESDGITKKSGLTSFTKRLWKDGVESALPVTITEILSSGEYKSSFTPDAVGFWVLEVTIGYNGEVWYSEFEVSQAEMHLNATMSDDSTTAVFGLWFDKGGQRVTDFDSISAVIRNTSGTLIVNLGTVTSDTPDGIFRFTTASGNLANLTAYAIIATAVKGAKSWIGQAGFTKV